ncbi:iron-containing alcohol dehydrogenase [Streptomyces sp. NPDC050600]|uniref:iron-containing alcohol dehydrogenase n=1 Tax=Streptomyces sp. NPDC050600 TaxID=3157213 RepID=UPI0034251CF0
MRPHAIRPWPPAVWQRSTRVHLGEGALAEALAEERAAHAVVVVDARQPGLPALVGPVPHAARTTLVRLDPAACGLDTVVRLAETLRTANVVVAAGGGTVLDAAALARLCVAVPGTPGAVRLGGGRPGLVRGPAGDATPSPRLVAVPTTVGTAAEVSAAATVVVDGHRKLVMHPLLAADVAALDPAATATLAVQSVLEGALEAVLRLCNGYLPQPTRRCPAPVDGESTSLLRDLVRAAEGGAPTLDIAVLSTRTILGFAAVGRDPFAGKVWYLANELSSLAGIRKIPATLAVLPPVWSRVRDGDSRFGIPARLAEVWETIRAASRTDLPRDPAAGITALADSWGITPPSWPLPRRTCTTPVAPDAGVLAARAVRAWGGGLPMLHGIGHDDLVRLYADALRGAGAVQ